MSKLKAIELEKEIEENVKAMHPLIANDDTCRVVDAWQDLHSEGDVRPTPVEALNDLAQYACWKMGEELDEEEEELDFVYISDLTKSIVDEWIKRFYAKTSHLLSPMEAVGHMIFEAARVKKREEGK